MTGPADTLAELRSRGLSVRAGNDGTVRIQPAGQLSPELRAAVLANKPAIIDLLRIGDAWYRESSLRGNGNGSPRVGTSPCGVSRQACAKTDAASDRSDLPDVLVPDGWRADRWVDRLTYFADGCEFLSPSRAAWLRAWAARVERVGR